MKQDNILQKAVLSEKAYQLMEKGVYTFFIAKKASKKDVKNSVEKMFSVNVAKVNIAKSVTNQKRIAKTRKTVTVGGSKKALVYLKAGQTISALSPKTESKVKKTKSSGEKDIEKISAEGKEA